jgi:hypothetical protein
VNSVQYNLLPELCGNSGAGLTLRGVPFTPCWNVEAESRQSI